MQLFVARRHAEAMVRSGGACNSSTHSTSSFGFCRTKDHSHDLQFTQAGVPKAEQSWAKAAEPQHQLPVPRALGLGALSDHLSWQSQVACGVALATGFSWLAGFSEAEAVT